MAHLNVKGLEDFSSMMASLGTKGEALAKMSMYDGAAILIDYIKQEIRAIPEEEGYIIPGGKRQVVTARDKQALLDHVGIAHMTKHNGVLTVSIGFDGYTEYTTKQYPGGVPVSLLARSIISGSSVRHRYDFLRKAYDRAQAAVQDQMQLTFIQSIQDYIMD